MRALKLFGLIAGGILALVVLCAIALLIFIDPNDYRSDIERLARQHTGRDLHIGGKIDLKLFPWLALEIHDVSLGNPPGYGEDAFAVVTSASVGVKLLPLLRNRMEVRRVTLDGLKVNLISRSDTDNNWKDLGTSSSAPESEQSTGTLSAKVAGVDITRAALSYTDEAQHSTQQIKGLEVHLGEIGGQTFVPTKVALDYSTEKGPVAHIALSALVKVAQAGAIEAHDLQLEALLHGEKKPVPLTLSSASILFDPHAQTLAPATIDLTYDGTPARLSIAGGKLLGDRNLSGTLTLPETRAVPKPLKHAALSSNFRLGRNDIRLTKLDLRFDDSRLTGAAGIDDLERMAMSFDLALDRIDLDHYLGTDSKEAGAGKASGGGASTAKAQSTPVELPLKFLRTLNAKGRFRIGQAKVSGLVLTEVGLPLEAAGGLAHLAPTKARLYGGTYNGDIRLDARPATAQLSLDEHLHAVDMSAFGKALFDSERFLGRADLDIKLNSAGNTDTALISGLNGRIQMNVRDGALNGFDLWYEIRRARALLARQMPPARAGPARTTFKTLSASALLDDGVARNDDLKADMDYLKVLGKGTVNLTSKAVDYRIVTQVYGVPAGETGSDLRDLRAAEIPVTITGTLDDMKVRPDLGGMLKSRVKEEVKKKLGDKLKDLLRRP